MRNTMTHSNYQGVPGILRPFKEYLESQSLSPGAEVVFFGVPGTCTPFVELLCYAARSLPCSFFFVPYLHEEKSRKMVYTDGIGYSPGDISPVTSPAVLVLMGGLAMPGVPVKKEEVEEMLQKYAGISRAGICFMHMFEKAGWLETISFDLLIDATISVDVLTE